MNPISRLNLREKRKKTNKRITEMRKIIKAKQLEEENKKFEASKITVDKYGTVTKKVYYGYDEEDY